MAIATYAVTTAHIAPKRKWKLIVIPLLLVINLDQPSFVPEPEPKGSPGDGGTPGLRVPFGGNCDGIG
jgi:hypothetical protein